MKVVGEDQNGCLVLPASSKPHFLGLLASLIALFFCDYPEGPASKRQSWRLQPPTSNPTANLMRDSGKNKAGKKTTA